MKFIQTTLEDFFKIGPGPSSSHTIGPMRAALFFRKEIENLSQKKIEQAHTIEVTLYGSLSATGKGHGTPQAILAGLLGYEPHKCVPEFFNNLFKESSSYTLQFKNKKIDFHYQNIKFGPIDTQLKHPNTMEFKLLDTKNNILLKKIFYSVGGGFLSWPNKKLEHRKIPYPFSSMKELKNIIKKTSLSFSQIILENEKALTQKTEEKIFFYLRKVLNTMEMAVKRGIKTSGVLPGSIGLKRKAPKIYQRAQILSDTPDKFLMYLNAYCLAVAEENAAGHLIVTAPTSGSAGVLPGVLYILRHHFHYDIQSLLEGLLVAAGIGYLIKQNASISGAEVGCMGEIGSASAMAAGMIAAVNGYSIQVVENAAEIALEHHLGMTCDPVAGLVQIPCIERNAMGGVKAFNAYILATSGDPNSQKVNLDQVIQVMAETGKALPAQFRETSLGGLARTLAQC
ncbi:L-serine dehydratase [Desulfonauticus submarinus]|uniref:L-serine dehydratase n=1 Tax=Desulfonauticus submarinus TaxID=206665 RepID=A0A1H0ERA3_9BACT|nr:L-serine ammonia-lyase [Desulfonauticus submarinus]SDN84881.1 L-serine dehydratase [Desulfonauticus submarinus]